MESLQGAAEANVSGKVTVAVSATFTAEPVGAVLSFWFDRLGVDSVIRFAPYNQVFQQFLDPSSLLAGNRGGVNLVLVRLEDWVRFRDSSAATIETLEEDVRHLIACLRSAAETFASSLLVAVCPCSPAFLAQPGNAGFIEQMTQSLETGLAGLGSVHILSSAELEKLYPVEKIYDPHGDELGHVPYTDAYFAALGTLAARKIRALRAVPYKVAAVDCDDTLWNGICGEDGPEGVLVDPPRRALQEFFLAQQEAGMLLCLCSKNNMEDVIETFRAHPEMPLRLENFVAQRINWSAKSANLASLAEELQLAPDDFIFIDDSAQECGEVQARRPEVLALPLPADPRDIPEYLNHVWAFDRLRVTEEDRRRVALYSQRAERARLERQSQTLEEFIASLRLKIDLSPLKPEQLPRAAQLTERTNQMNFTSLRRSEASIRGLVASSEAECLVVEVSDRFGTYGLTGLAIFGVGPDALRVDTFLLSCRVLGRGVEHRLLARLGEIADERGLSRVEVPFLPSHRNQPALMFLESVGAAFKVPAQRGSVFVFPAAYAARIKPKPSAPAPVPAARPPASRSASREPVDFVYIASRLRSVEQIQAAMSLTRRDSRVYLRPAAAPRTPLERELATLWAELLRLPAVGIHDNFFDIGGHSLLAVQLLSRVREACRVDLSLDVVYTSAFTVAELAKAVEVRQIEQSDPAEYSDILAELENLSDEEVRRLLERENGREERR